MIKNGTELRCGYTTGTCATAAAVAAFFLLLAGEKLPAVQVQLPQGEQALISVQSWQRCTDSALCWVQKDGGDDPDVTHGAMICAQAFLLDRMPERTASPEECSCQVFIDGGEGVGRVTGPGLQIPAGYAAINPVPRKMIAQQVRAACQRLGCSKPVKVIISVGNGRELAKKTFNPRLGIEDGISILGTTGIVEPMSEQALVETIHILVDKARLNNPNTILLTPGNYGRDYCLHQLGLNLENGVKFSNFLGETLDYVKYRGFRQLLLVGHVGKLVKIAGGVMNTNSSVADCRMEILTAHAAMAGAGQPLAQALMESKTTDEALVLLESAGLEKAVFDSVLHSILFHLAQRTEGTIEIGAAVFTTGERLLIASDNLGQLVRALGERACGEATEKGEII